MLRLRIIALPSVYILSVAPVRVVFSSSDNWSVKRNASTPLPIGEVQSDPAGGREGLASFRSSVSNQNLR
jgi:hypothetical protein